MIKRVYGLIVVLCIFILVQMSCASVGIESESDCSTDAAYEETTPHMESHLPAMTNDNVEEKIYKVCFKNKYVPMVFMEWQEGSNALQFLCEDDSDVYYPLKVHQCYREETEEPWSDATINALRERGFVPIRGYLGNGYSLGTEASLEDHMIILGTAETFRAAGYEPGTGAKFIVDGWVISGELDYRPDMYAYMFQHGYRDAETDPKEFYDEHAEVIEQFLDDSLTDYIIMNASVNDSGLMIIHGFDID